jgi:hypothetical protein
MANSLDPMTRLDRFEASVEELKSVAWRTTEILADHSERLSGLQRSLDGVNERLDQLSGVNERLGGVNERLDRLIAVTIQERTASVERLGDIERRLTKLEERVGR